MEGNFLIRIENISKYFSSGGKVTPALHKIDLSFRVGEFIAITGASGSGKTTLLNLISGSLIPDSGEIYYQEEKVSEFDSLKLMDYQKNHVGYIYQDNKLIPHYTVLENIVGPMLLQGESPEKALKQAEEILKKVGMENYAGFKAYKLSAGQRQRLGIARVLAKESKIIIADEPTANLDSETGNQIMEILRSMSKDHLVIMVNHKMEEVKKYATRMIRIHSGNVEEDTEICNSEAITNSMKEDKITKKIPRLMEDEPDSETVMDTNPRKQKNSHLTLSFLKWNMKSRPISGILLTIFMILTGLMTTIFFGMYFSNADDTLSKVYDNSAFKNINDKRLIVRRADNSSFTVKDVNSIKKLKYVKDIEFYDCISDIYYYLFEGKDYEYNYTNGSFGNVLPLDNSHFMRSVSSLDQSNLYLGRMPENKNEVVISSNDKTLIGTSLRGYFRVCIPTLWTNDFKTTRKLKVVGLVRGNSGQAYFENSLCEMYNAEYKSADIIIPFKENVTGEDFTETSPIIPIIDDDLTGNNVAFSTLFRGCTQFSPYGEFKLVATLYDTYKVSAASVKEIKINCIDKKMGPEDEETLTFKDKHGSQEYTIDKFDDFPCVEVGSDLFYQIFDRGSAQMTVYIDDYVHTDQVLKELKQVGNYIPASAYRMSMNEYDPVKNQKREQILLLSATSLLVLCFGAIVLINVFLYACKKDYETLNYLGMSNKKLWKIKMYEMMIYSIIAYFITATVLLVLSMNKIPIVLNYLKWFFVKQYLISSVYYFFIILLAGFIFYGLLQRFVMPRKPHIKK
jgi:ABC-type antimicrobial peptide transport system, ATPase component